MVVRLISDEDQYIPVVRQFIQFVSTWEKPVVFTVIVVINASCCCKFRKLLDKCINIVYTIYMEKNVWKQW